MHKSADEQTSFRDSLATVSKEGKRIWINPKKPFGFFYQRRIWLSYALLLFLFAGPYLRIGGQPILMLNILERKFIILGEIFWPHDFHLFALLALIGILFIIVFTIVFGRIFCGWVCPQTIFMEMVFRRIEYWLEGDYTYQKQLNKLPWSNKQKILKRGTKYLIFWFISFLIANTFLAYIIGSEALIDIISSPIKDHIQGFISILIFTSVFFFVFAWFREQVCTVVCPYGRLQGVLLDRNSIVVAYDHIRGELRALFNKQEDRKSAGKGDCIDCYQCVQVCPTGIDIRNGTQLECVNCTACIDACDAIMHKVGLEPGLIRYASERNIADNKPSVLTARIIGSSIALILLTVAFFYILWSRSSVEASVLRTPGLLYQEVGNDSISNLYNYKLVNKTNEALDVTIFLENTPQGRIQFVGKAQNHIQPQALTEGSFFIVLPKATLIDRKTSIEIGIKSNNEVFEIIQTNFIKP